MVTCPNCAASYADDDTRFCGRCGRDMRSSAVATAQRDESLVGRVIDGRYRILSKLGHGGMGAVYKVEHVAMGKLAAMKLLHPGLSGDPEIGARFLREAKAVSRLSHNNTVQVFDFGESKGLMYLVMELVRGEDMGVILRRDGVMTFARAAPILSQVCDALSEAHEAGVIHRDVKPENLIITRSKKGRDVVKVLDFGLAKLRGADDAANTSTQKGALIGTPFYMSPEQIRGEEPDARSDIYSLGAVLYRAVTDKHPFEAATPVAVLTQHLTEPLILPTRRRPDLHLPPVVDDIVACAMAKDKIHRYASVDDMRAALEAAMPSSTDSMTPTPTSPPPSIQSLDGRRASDTAPRREETGSTPISAEAQLRREDLDAYEKQIKRRRVAGLVIVPVVIFAAVGAIIGKIVWSTPKAAEVEAEPNNSPSEANLITQGKVVRGVMGKRITTEESDRDYYQFDLKKGERVVRLDLTGIPNMDLKLGVFNSLGKKLVEADVGGDGDGEIIPNLRLPMGTYYVAVRQVWVKGQPALEDDKNGYTLGVGWRQVSGNEESEPNDEPAQALTLKTDQPMRGYLSRPGDLDCFRMDKRTGTMSGLVSGIDGVDLRVLVVPPDATTLSPLPTGTKVFDKAGVGSGEKFADVPADRLIVVERKVRKESEDEGLTGLATPYSITVRVIP